MDDGHDSREPLSTNRTVERPQETYHKVFYYGKSPNVEIMESEHIPLADLCDSCHKIFNQHHDKNREYRLDQTYIQFQSAVETQSCSLCYLRWSQMSAEERLENWTDMIFQLSSYGLDSDISIMFEYSKGTGGLKTECSYTMILVPVSEFADSKDHITDVCSPRSIPHQLESTGSKATLAQAHSWYRNCIKKHTSCSVETSTAKTLPSRLIYLGEGTTTTPALVETKDLALDIVYMTVSHCWGQHRITCLSHENIDDMKLQVPASAISKSFQEAMDIAKHFGVSYAWIDSLCIIQKDLQDWQKESLMMADAYRNARCNIAATAAPDGRAGCFFERSRLAILPCKVNVTWRTTSWNKFYVVQSDCWTKNINNSPLGRRAWVVQERYLARRMIHFAEDQLFWECREQKACEAFPERIPSLIQTRINPSGVPQRDDVISLKRTLSVPDVAVEKALEIWYGLVGEYTNANLTEERDKLVAIAGLAKTMAPHMKGRYLAGLWEYWLPLQLLWSVMFLGGKKIETYQAPSWSWASLEGKIRLNSISLETREQQNSYVAIEILDAQIITLTNDPMGQVKSGFLRISGFLAKATVQNNGFICRLMKYRQDSSGIEETAVRMFQADTPDLESGQTVYCLPVDVDDYSISGLVMQPRKRDGQSDEVCFERVGTFNTHDYKMVPDSEAPLVGCQSFWQQCLEFPEQQQLDDPFYLAPAASHENGFLQYIFILE